MFSLSAISLLISPFGDEHQHFYLAGGKLVGIGVAGGMRRHGGAETVRLLVGVSVLVSVPMKLQNVFSRGLSRPDRCSGSVRPIAEAGCRRLPVRWSWAFRGRKNEVCSKYIWEEMK